MRYRFFKGYYLDKGFLWGLKVCRHRIGKDLKRLRVLEHEKLMSQGKQMEEILKCLTASPLTF